MRSPYSRQSNAKIIIYAIVLAVLVGMGVVVMQDINVPTEHVTQDIEVTVDE